MKLITEKVKVMKSLTNIIGKINKEVNFVFKPEGIYVKVADPSNIALMIVNITTRVFKEYTCDKEEVVLVDMDEFVKILGKVKESEILTMETSESELVVTSKGKYQRVYKIRIRDDDKDAVKWDDSKFKYTAEAICDAGGFTDAMDDLSVVGEVVQFVISGESFNIKGFDEDNQERAIMNMSAGVDKSKTKTVADKECISKFSNRFLSKVLSARGIASTVRLRMGDSTPMELYYNVPDVFNLKYYQAPRVDVDD